MTMQETSEPFRLSIKKDAAPEIRCTTPNGLFWPVLWDVMLAPHVHVVVSCVVPASPLLHLSLQTAWEVA
jgi:hypothetical protein